VFLPHLAIPEDDVMTTTPRKACKDWFQGLEDQAGKGRDQEGQRVGLKDI